MRIAAAVLLGGLAGSALLSFTSTTTGDVGPGQVELRAGLGEGHTMLRLPPFGTVSADTHDGPIAVEVRVDEVDVGRVQQLLAEGEPAQSLQDEVESDLRPLTGRLVRRSLLLTALVGAAAGALMPGRRWYSAAAGSAGGLVAVTVLMGATWASFDARAFDAAPVFNGPLAEAPRLVDTVLRHVESFEEVRDRYEVLSAQIADLYSANVAADTGAPGRETRILHVSDIHLNPIGLELTRQLARQFRVHAVLDTGDLTSFGQPFEAAIVPLVEEVDAPYLYVPGNHDSPANVAAVAGAENVVLLDGVTAEVGEVEILGLADPTFTARGELSTAEANEVVLSAAPAVRPLLREHRPDVLAVHNPRLASRAGGLVPYAVSGHTHRTSSTLQDGMLMLTVGSTGSGGLGEFTELDEPRYEAQILRFDGDRLVAVDRVMLEGRDGDFEISREVLEGRPRPGRAGWGGWREARPGGALRRPGGRGLPCRSWDGAASTWPGPRSGGSAPG